VRRSWNPTDDPDKEHVETENVISLAGNFAHDGHSFEHWWTPLEPKDDHPGGLEFRVYGPKYGKMKQQAIIDFQCDRSDNNEKRDGDDKPTQSEGDVEFISYDPEPDLKKDTRETLRLRWKTKYACADYAGSHGTSSGGWGFFTWLVLM
jgi:hypothetical protein